MPTCFINKIVLRKDLDFFNSLKKFPITITAEDIRSGTQKDNKACPFVIAAKRCFPGVKHAYVLRTKAFLEYKDRMVRFDLPSSVVRLIAKYDRTGKMEPGDYWLNPVTISAVPSVQKKYNKKLKKRRQNGTAPAAKKVGPWTRETRLLTEPK